MSAFVTRVVRPAALGVLACGLVLTGAACSSDDGTDTPQTTVSQTAPADLSVSAGTTDESDRDSSGDSTMTCARFRSLDDPARADALRGLGVTSNTEQIATVAATVCLSRPDDKISVVIDELVPGR